MQGFKRIWLICLSAKAQTWRKLAWSGSSHLDCTSRQFLASFNLVKQKRLRELARHSLSWQQRFSHSARGATKGRFKTISSSGLFWLRSDFRLPAANVQPPRFALRVCEKCVIASGSMSSAPAGWDGSLEVSRSAGNGYNPKGVLQQTAKMAAEVSWRGFEEWNYMELPSSPYPSVSVFVGISPLRVLIII